MAQHDYIIDNQTSANLRADLNNALAAIVSQNSGATAPAATFANQFWYDTSTDQLKQRNEANTVWITLGTTDQTNNKFEPNQTFATQAEAEAGTNNTKAVTPLRVEQFNLANNIGWGQTWQDVTASRAVSTSYQNTTARPILTAIGLNGGSTRRFIEISVDNSTWIKVGSDSGSDTPNTIIVPVNYYYRVNGSTAISYWSELR